MAVYANWVHGSMVQPQRQGFFVNTVRAGYGAQFLSHNEPGKGGEWFHIGVPNLRDPANPPRCALPAANRATAVRST
jgi:hypothetical protein